MKTIAREYRELLGANVLNDLDRVTAYFADLSKELTPKLRQRFCKDWNIPVKLFVEPYFSERLAVYNQQTFVAHLLGEFVRLVGQCGGEQEYFTLYNEVKNKAIQFLNDSEEMMFFSRSEDMNKYAVRTQFPTNDIYKQTFIGKTFISVDLVKGNYTALRHYNPAIVGNTDSYEDFMAMFTSEPYLQGSKYIRQVIFGNVNPKRQVTYEKYLMGEILNDLLEQGIVPASSVVFFSSDEFVLDADGFTAETIEKVREVAAKHKADGINNRVEHFVLRFIKDTETYVKEFLTGEAAGTLDFKCMTSLMMPFIFRAVYGNPANENDNVFDYEGRLAKWLEGITINLDHEFSAVKSWERL